MLKMNFRPLLWIEVATAATIGIRCFSVTSATAPVIAAAYGPSTRSTLSRAMSFS
jgi:hypothetical protein